MPKIRKFHGSLDAGPLLCHLGKRRHLWQPWHMSSYLASITYGFAFYREMKFLEGNDDSVEKNVSIKVVCCPMHRPRWTSAIMCHLGSGIQGIVSIDEWQSKLMRDHILQFWLLMLSFPSSSASGKKCKS